jgi:hypothetical protein
MECLQQRGQWLPEHTHTPHSRTTKVSVVIPFVAHFRHQVNPHPEGLWLTEPEIFRIGLQKF